MSDYPDLGALGGLGDGARQRRKQIGMQARLWLVERDERGQAVREQGAQQRQELQCAVAELAGAEGAVRQVGTNQ